jgi:hypothetical protein
MFYLLLGNDFNTMVTMFPYHLEVFPRLAQRLDSRSAF